MLSGRSVAAGPAAPAAETRGTLAPPVTARESPTEQGAGRMIAAGGRHGRGAESAAGRQARRLGERNSEIEPMHAAVRWRAAVRGWASAVLMRAGVALAPAAVEARRTAPAPPGAGRRPSPGVRHARQRGEVVPPDLDDVEHMCALLTSCDKLPIPPSLIPPDFAVVREEDDRRADLAPAASTSRSRCASAGCSRTRARACAPARCTAPTPTPAPAAASRASSASATSTAARSPAGTTRSLAVRDCPRGGEQCLVATARRRAPSGRARRRRRRRQAALLRVGDAPAALREGQAREPRLRGLRPQVRHRRPTGPPACATAGPPCAGSAKRCEGEHRGRLLQRPRGARRLRRRRADVHRRRRAGRPSARACRRRRPSAGAIPDQAPRCDGANIKYCVAGKPRSHFCKAMGFNKCDSSHNGPHCAL